MFGGVVWVVYLNGKWCDCFVVGLWNVGSCFFEKRCVFFKWGLIIWCFWEIVVVR